MFPVLIIDIPGKFLTKITDIKNKTARNLIRGAFGATKFEDAFSAIEEFRRVSNADDAVTAYNFLRNSPLAKSFPFPEDFPDHPVNPQSNRLHKQGSYKHELAQVSARAHAESGKLVGFLDKISEINGAVAARDANKIAELFQLTVSDYGYSIVLLRKAISVRDLFKEEKELEASIGQLISTFTTGKRSTVAIGIEDLMDKERDYASIRATLYKYMQSSSFPETISLIVSNHLSWFPNSKNEFYKLLQAYGYHSLIDAVWFLQANSEELKQIFSNELAGAVNKAIPDNFACSWKRLYQNIPCEILQIFEEKYESFSDYNLLRYSFAWSEYNDVRSFRFAVDSVLGERLDAGLSGSSCRLLGTKTPVITRDIEEIVSTAPSKKLNIASIDPSSGGILSKTLGFIHFIERFPEFEFQSGEDALCLLSRTTNIANLLTWGEISSIFNEEVDDLSRFLSAALKNGNLPSSRSEHTFRKATERLATAQFHSDVIELTKRLYDLSPQLIAYCIVEFDEVFLSKLFTIISSRSEAIQTRVQLLDFYGSVTDDTSYKNRASVLNAEAKLALVRADLDDIRIAVDLQKFREWLDENLSADIRPLSKSTAIENLEIISGEQINDTRAVYSSQSVKIAELCNRAYKQFCANQYWGIDSYVGRRIRHGTLEGMMLGELRVMISNATEEFSSIAPRFSEGLNEWLTDVEKSVFSIGTELLRVQSEAKLKGAFSASVTAPNKNKVLNEAIKEITKSMVSERSSQEAIALLGVYCWNFLEIDLANLKVELDQIRTKDFLLNRQVLLSHIPQNRRGEASRLLGNIDEKTLEIFQKLSGWLTRPSVVQPSAKISELFQAVVAEIHEYAPTFTGNIETVGDLDVEIFSGRYHHVYDILNVLVANAAKHGPANGTLRLVVEKCRIEGCEEIKIHFLSEAISGPNAHKSKRRITEAMQASLENALVQENFSGIRKARHIVENNEELSTFQYTEPTPNFHKFSFSVSAPNA